MRSHAHKHGFTLLELSITLVIIGLVVGGIMAGSTIVRASAMRGDIEIIQKLQLAMHTFRDEYDCIAGDCKDASTKLYGAHDGDGNGYITGQMTSDVPEYTLIIPSTEYAYVMDDLARAKLIGLSPFDPTASTAAAPATGLPQLRSNRDGILISGVDWYNAKFTKHFIRFPVQQNTDPAALNTVSCGPRYTPDEAYSIDNKLDDGLPFTGDLTSAYNADWDSGECGELSVPAASGDCVSDTTGNPYALNTTTQVCGLKFLLKF